MELEVRKNELRELALNSKSNGSMIYQLINDGVLDCVINKIDDRKTKTIVTSLVKKGYLTGNEQFIDILSEYIYNFERWFAPLCNKKAFIGLSLDYKSPKFLLCKNYWGNNVFIPYYQFNMKQTIIANMYDNIKFIYDEYKDFFKSIGISNRMTLKNGKSVEKLFKFMQELIWCNYDEYALFYAFDNYKHIIEETIIKEKTAEEIKNIIWNSFDDQWSRLITNYLNKINTVKKIVN